MGMKLWNLQAFFNRYRCLGHNHFSPASLSVHHERRRAEAVVKVIKSDGVVNIYRRPIKASVLMLQFPKHLVCHSHSFYIGQKIQPLSPNDKLQLGHNYFLLPIHFFQSVLSFVSIASSFASFKNSLSATNNNTFVVNREIGSCQAFDIRKAPSGCLQVRVSDEFVSKLMQRGEIDGVEEEMNSRRGKICSTPQLQKDYTQLVSYRPQWKPKLDTIKESKRRKLSSSSFGIKRRKKYQEKIRKSKHEKHHHQKGTKIKTKTKAKR